MKAAHLRGLALVLLMAITPAPAAAQAIAAVERKLLPYLLGPLQTVPASFWEGLRFLRDEEDRQRSLKADISFGLTGDEAGDQSLFRLNTGIGLSRGVFPSEVSVVTRVFLQLRDGQLQEDVTSLQISYDYHGSHHVEYFAFAERFSDSFLSIQQRYEVGLGARVGVHLGRSREWRNAEARFAAVQAALPDVQAALAAVPNAGASGAPDVLTSDWAGFRSAVSDLRHVLEYRRTRLFVGLSASLFSEIESASLTVVTLPIAPTGGSADAPARTRVSLGPQQRYRMSFRPTFIVRPAGGVQVTVMPYFKLPLDGARRVTLPDGSRPLDYRRDILSELNWSIRREQTGLENVALVLTFNHFFDRVPPALPASLIADTLAAGRVFDRTVAEGTHRVTALSLRLTW